MFHYVWLHLLFIKNTCLWPLVKFLSKRPESIQENHLVDYSLSVLVYVLVHELEPKKMGVWLRVVAKT